MSPIVWKRLTGQALTMADLASFDSVAANTLKVCVCWGGGGEETYPLCVCATDRIIRPVTYLGPACLRLLPA